jgi:hypothetical protein
MADEIKTPADVYGRLFEEVGIENRGELQKVLDEHMNDPVMTTGSVDDGIRYIVNLTKERLPKAPPPPEEPGPYDDGFVYRDGPKASEKGLTDAITRRKAYKRGWGRKAWEE